MLIRVFQILCIAITAAILWGFREAFMSLRTVFSVDFPIGFICGGVFVFLIYTLVLRLDSSSGPRRNAAEQQGPHDGI